MHLIRVTNQRFDARCHGARRFAFRYTTPAYIITHSRNNRNQLQGWPYRTSLSDLLSNQAMYIAIDAVNFRVDSLSHKGQRLILARMITVLPISITVRKMIASDCNGWHFFYLGDLHKEVCCLMSVAFTNANWLITIWRSYGQTDGRFKLADGAEHLNDVHNCLGLTFIYLISHISGYHSRYIISVQNVYPGLLIFQGRKLASHFNQDQRLCHVRSSC